MKIYHHNDLDGKCAAAITLRYSMTGSISFKGIDLIEVDYKDKIDIEAISNKENIIIVDFSFKPEVMNEICRKTNAITWLDHHKTAFEYKYDCEIAGIRTENYAGCELAWQYFCKDKPMPLAVTLIGDYDKWALKHQPQCFEFYEGMKLFQNGPKEELWDELFMSDGKTREIINGGKCAIQYRDNYCLNIRKSYGYEVQWNGYKAYATNFYAFGSKGFGEKFSEYDFCIAYIHDGSRFTVSLYSEKIDVSEICKQQGGGGHKGAAGFVCENLPFKKVL